MSQTAIILGPQDQGRRMTLAEFDHAEVGEGRRYELNRGAIIVSDTSDYKHVLQIDAINQQLYLHKAGKAGAIRMILGGSHCKMLIEAYESERHPDISVYKTDAPDTEDIWSVWAPEIVIEIVSPGSEKRDYEEKPEEYLAFGVAEYWIFDEPAQKVTVLQRSGGRWKTSVLGPEQTIKTHLLPQFELNIAAVFNAAKLS